MTEASTRTKGSMQQATNGIEEQHANQGQDAATEDTDDHDDNDDIQSWVRRDSDEHYMPREDDDTSHNFV